MVQTRLLIVDKYFVQGIKTKTMLFFNRLQAKCMGW